MTKKNILPTTESTSSVDNPLIKEIEIILAEDSKDELDFMFAKQTTETTSDVDIMLHQHNAAGILHQYYTPPSEATPENNPATSEPVIVIKTEANILHDLGIEKSKPTRK